jgi:PAS domain S-box-containing protein
LKGEIAERRRVENQLRILSSVVEQSTSAIAILDMRGQVQYVNPAFLELNRLDREEVVGKNWRSFVSAFSTLRDRFPEIRETVLQRRETWRGEIDTKTRDGRVFWREATIFPIMDVNGEVVRSVYMSRDVTERKLAEQALRESRERLTGFMDAASDSFYLLDENLDFVTVNARGSEIIGRPREEVIGRNIREIVPDVEESGRYARHQEVIRTGEPFVIENFVPHPTFGDMHFILKSFKVGNGLGVIASDITPIKNVEEGLRRYAERLQALHEIDRGIQTAQSLEEIIRAALGHMRQLVPCQRAGITLIGSEASEGVFFSSHLDTETQEEPATRLQLELSQDVVETLRRGEIAVIGNLPSPGEMSKAPHAEGVRSALVVPMIAQGELLGTLDLFNPREITDEQEDTARQVADQLAIAIQQARLNEQVQRYAEEMEQRVADRTRELQAMYEVMAIANEALDLETTLERSLGRVLEAMRSDAGSIHLLDDGEQQLRLVAQQGVPPEVVAQIESLPRESHPVGWVVEHNQPLAVPDVTFDAQERVRTVPQTYVGMPIQSHGQTVGVLSILRESAQPQFGEEEVALLTSIADQVGAVVESSRLRRRAEQAAVLEERQRLARGLHDSVTQALYSVTLLAETGRLASQAADMETAESCLERLGGVTQQALKEMRLLIYELRPPALETEGLAGALQQRLDAVESRAGVDARLLVQGEVDLTAPQEEALYRIALEALNNALKHAEANTVTVWIFHDGKRKGLEVTDDGRGFDPETVADLGGLGLVMMRERAEQVGADVTIRSTPGEGTRVEVSIG